MGLIINENISAIGSLRKDGININPKNRYKDLPKVLILNLMPNKSETEYQLLRLLGNSFTDIQVDFLYTKTYKPKNTNLSYLQKAYKRLDEVENTNYDGMIITGAPLEFMDFNEIAYWKELRSIMDYSSKYTKSTIYICWAAVAGLYYKYNISKTLVDKKVTGVFSHQIINGKSLLFKNCGEKIISPHSRYFTINEEDIKDIANLEILAKATDAGIYILADKEGKDIYITGHPEYSTDTLGNEYKRDINKGLVPELPKNYFPENDFTILPENTWRTYSQALIDNWIGYYLMNGRGKVSC